MLNIDRLKITILSNHGAKYVGINYIYFLDFLDNVCFIYT
eukprot:UN01345